jgi:Avidin family
VAFHWCMTYTRTRHTVSPDAVRGTWCNQLGSRLSLEVDASGTLTGQYRSGTGLLAGNAYPLHGSCDPRPSAFPMALGFVVDWCEVHGITAWVGHYFPEEEVIRTTWIMATETDPQDDWKSTVVGHDVFHRDRPID